MAGEPAALEAQALDNRPLRAAAVDEETRALIVPDAADLPALPPTAVEANFARYFVAGKWFSAYHWSMYVLRKWNLSSL